ncbi:MAG: hypothetical protein AAB426_10145 [Myxococcota bacterium]
MRRTQALVGLMLAVELVTAPAAAGSLSLWPFRSAAEERLEQARDARERGQWALAAALLDETAAMAGAPRAPLLRERGLLLRDEGQLDQALEPLRLAADLDADSDSRLDLAAVLVTLGRWPEAVVVLRRAFDERTTSLPIARVTSDSRFAPLGGFGPYDDLVGAMREEQAGPWGKLMLKLDALEASAREARIVVRQLMDVVGIVMRLASTFGANVLLFVLFGLIITFGVNQLGLTQPPWTVLIGMGVGAGAWHLGARVATGGARTGLATILPGLLVVATPYVVMALVRWLWRRRRRLLAPARKAAFAPKYLPRTVRLLDEVAQLGHRYLGADDDVRVQLADELRLAEVALRRRLRLDEPVEEDSDAVSAPPTAP